MKKLTLYTFWTILCLHTTVSFADAATGIIDSALAEIDVVIAASSVQSATESGAISTNVTKTGGVLTLNSASSQAIIRNDIHLPTLTSWEILHRTAMLQGFTWGGYMANYITPAMYIGTPFQTNQSMIGYNVDMGATNYTECVRAETDASFGPHGEYMEKTIEDELRNMAKYCATEYLGTYFEGKDYTTREEMLMFLFTMFDEDMHLSGYFQDGVFVFSGDETQTTYSNVSSRAWYAPYLSLAYDLIMVEDENTWTVARAVTDDDIAMMLDMYFLDENNQPIDTISTRYGDYTLVSDVAGFDITKSPGTKLMFASAPEVPPIDGDDSITTE